MAESQAQRAVPTSPDGLLAAPSVNPVELSQNRSTSPVPSHGSSQSRQTVVEETEADPELRKTFERRHQTFKLRQKLSRWMFFMGFLSPNKGTQKVEQLVIISQLDVPDDRMFDHEASPFNKDVSISPKYNSNDYHKARCLLDTGCFQSNIVSKRLVEDLGYTEADYEPLSETERFGSTTLSGEHISFEGVIRLSWHHNTSTHRYHRMRFLVSTTTQCDMIIGVRSITKYNLLTEMVLATQQAATLQVATNVPADAKTLTLKDELSKLKSSIGNYTKAINEQNALPEATRDKKLLAQYKKRLAEQQHKHHVQELRVDARNAELQKDLKQAKKLAAKADEEERQWNAKHPPKKPANTPTPASSSIGSSSRQPGPVPVSPAKMSTSSHRKPT
ncbi:hypothetical protein OPT61_g9088 [Boeremia exigua]|uniref:Uncharacterized protein n=1 Tax=Boeremia exigua TaxID=749465 RepID=A0ACC2HWG7_9PLEO|nr:hypothetical protein OPT61_g9088 [Boeremia exigua]